MNEINDNQSGSSDSKDALEDNKELGGLKDGAEKKKAAKAKDGAQEQQVFRELDLPPVAINRKKNKQSSLFLWLIFFIALMAAATAGYLAWLKYQDLQVSSMAVVSEEVALQGRQLKKLEDVLTQKAETLNAITQANKKEIAALLDSRAEMQAFMDKALAENQAILAAQSRRLRLLTATTTDDWRLAEVEYLLRLANQRILTSSDSESALSLLRSSDEILLELNNPSLFSVREAIANDRAALAMLAKQDINGIFLTLSALMKTIDALPIIDLPEFSAATEVPNNNSVVSEGESFDVAFLSDKVTAALKDALREVRSWIIIQRQDAEIEPLLPPEQQYYLKNNLRLMLRQAQLAALDARQAVYSDALNNAIQWLTDYFPNDQREVQVMKSELQLLREKKVFVELPDVSASLLAIKVYIAEQHSISKGDIKKSHVEEN